ncbi:hypothetical protein [Paracoccus sp. (in: a-proteobacteria)]|uniref:hypothetical protein n=1 Tax=Paracoccus sp. TaxID=267 RepID=UPI0026E0023B|nr:hypothetical protein [Paracoccus sp. (in: a-proteobacteria)]MDO5646598.1 hypothetical protein [Paracoccus sp. (in: a-proteobacteria)]
MFALQCNDAPSLLDVIVAVSKIWQGFHDGQAIRSALNVEQINIVKQNIDVHHAVI